MRLHEVPRLEDAEKDGCTSAFASKNIFFLSLTYLPTPFTCRGLLVPHDHTQILTYTQWDSSGRGIYLSQRILPDNTQNSRQTDIHAPGGTRNRNPSKRAAADLRLSPRGHQDRQSKMYLIQTGSFIYLYCQLGLGGGEGKIHPGTGHEVPEGEYRYSWTLSLTSAPDGVGGKRHSPTALSQGKTRY